MLRITSAAAFVFALGFALGLAACNDLASGIPVDAASDARHRDGGVPAIIEAADCDPTPLQPGSGVPLAVSGLRVADQIESVDLDGDGFNDNQLFFLGGVNIFEIPFQLGIGDLAIPLELIGFDANPDPCLKLALYGGTCVGACDFTDFTPDTIELDPATIVDGVARSRLRALSTTTAGHVTSAGTGYIELEFPFRSPDTNALAELVLPITVTHVTGSVGADAASLIVAGPVQAFQLAQRAAPLSSALDTRGGDTLLDAVYANLLGRDYLGLLRIGEGCMRTTLDLDGDGLELFCDSRIGDTINRVDVCIDGDGTEVHDGDNGLADCSQAMKHGLPRFVDGFGAQFAIDALRAEPFK